LNFWIAQRSSTLNTRVPRFVTWSCTIREQFAIFGAQQVLREIFYAATYLPRWIRVPDAAMLGLLQGGTQA
jgi:hypothetical protein